MLQITEYEKKIETRVYKLVLKGFLSLSLKDELITQAAGNDFGV